MKMAIVFVLASLVLLGGEPIRKNGLSLHLFPERVAQLSGAHGGLRGIDPITKALGQTFRSSEELLSYFMGLPETVRQNGIWIVTSNPDAYSEYELSMLSVLAKDCRERGIPCFICRAAELPNGWFPAK
jgi:hypothetical protein